MEGAASLFSLLFFSFTIFFSSFSILLYLLRVRLWCSCDLCHTFMTFKWSLKFDNLCDWYAYLLKESPTGTIHIHILGNIITANPENVEYILKTKFDNYPKGKPFSSVLGDLLGRGIFNVDGDPWRFQRKMASLELGSVSVRSYAFQIVAGDIQDSLLPTMELAAGGNAIDLQEVFRRFAFDSICKISFGLDVGNMGLSMPMSEFAAAFDLASNLSARRATAASPLIWKMKRLLNIGSERKLREAIAVVNVLAEEVMMNRRLGPAGRGGHDLLSRFMDSLDDDKYLRDIVISFLLAGRDTVASALTSFFWLMAKHPEVESRVLEETDQIMGQDQHIATYDQLKGMPYLHAAIYEAMRLHPPVQFDSKFADDDDILPDGTFVKKGIRVTYHPYAMGRMEEIWGKDCLQFNPERWLKGGDFAPESPFKYPVFQGGPRVCLGKELAIMEIKSVAVTLIRMFKIDVSSDHHEHEHRLRYLPGLTASLEGGLLVTVTHRSN